MEEKDPKVLKDMGVPSKNGTTFRYFSAGNRKEAGQMVGEQRLNEKEMGPMSFRDLGHGSEVHLREIARNRSCRFWRGGNRATL
jgi:hypothetical protein